MGQFREWLEWDWVYTTTEGGRRLHHVADMEGDEGALYENPNPFQAVTTCGLHKQVRIPGVISRMGMGRCARCCDKLGIARGIGSPKNDKALWPWVETRLAEARKAVEA